METINDLLGIETQRLAAYQLLCRVVVLFFYAVFLIRITGIRTLGKRSVFDALVAITIGTLFGNAIFNTDQHFGIFLLAALALLLLHRLIGWLSYRYRRVGWFFKGEKILLYKAGERLDPNCRKENISEEDMEQAIRILLGQRSLDNVDEIYLERSGEISVIKKEKQASLVR